MQATVPAALTARSPESHQHQDRVVHLQRSEIYRDYQQAFETTTGLPLGVRAVGSFQPPLHASKRLNPFCALMATKNKTCSACLQFQQGIEERGTQEPQTLECFAGLSESVVPIRVGEHVLAYLQTGQVLLRPPTAARFKKTARLLAEWRSEVDLEELKQAYFQTRVMTRQQYSSALRLLTIFAQHLSTLSNQLMVRETTAEPPMIARARAFIAEHQGEEISLSQVAKAVNMSPFYFCKMFKKATGVNFTEYVSRVRVERVKELLLNPHTRVSEAAFEAGFQSLSQFNRAFRHIAGEAPSDYRDRIHPHTPLPSEGERSLTYAA
jgi:AraC-like DNA-binding protein/ligand-binding sensor protein